jgi:hypothetical protein
MALRLENEGDERVYILRLGEIAWSWLDRGVSILGESLVLS